MATIAIEPRQRNLAEPPLRTRRLDLVDLIRGLVMVIMVLDHVRAYFTEVRFDPTDLVPDQRRAVLHSLDHPLLRPDRSSSSPARARGSRGPGGRATSFPGCLLSRGLWLILLEFTVISFGWYFNLRMEKGLVAQVIWVIGASMVVLSGLVYLPGASRSPRSA